MRTSAPTSDTGAPARRRRSRLGLAGGLLVATAALLVACFASIVLGSRAMGVDDIVAALTTGAQSADLTVIRDMRVPRTVLGLLVGAALGVSGALLQGLSRNPLADPGVMGINAGAAAAVVGGVLVLGAASASSYIWFAFGGAALAIVTVYAISSFGREGATPLKLALAGAAVTAVCTSITSAIVLSDPSALEELRRWQVGALSGRYAPVLDQLAPYLVVGVLGALLAGRALNAVSLGDDLARSLGLSVRRTRVVVLVLVTLLCGAATAACGPIVFVGLMVPHVARLICGPDYRWILPYSALLGAVLLLACDILGRVLAAPAEVEVGVVVGIIGAPAFIALVRYRRLAEV